MGRHVIVPCLRFHSVIEPMACCCGVGEVVVVAVVVRKDTIQGEEARSTLLGLGAGGGEIKSFRTFT